MPLALAKTCWLALPGSPVWPHAHRSGVIATGGYLSLLPGQGLLPMAGLLATQAMPGLIPGHPVSEIKPLPPGDKASDDEMFSAECAVRLAGGTSTPAEWKRWQSPDC